MYIKHILTPVHIGLSAAILPDLSTLQITHNHLTSKEDIEHLAYCDKISVLDLSHNKLEDGEIICVLEKMKSLVSQANIYKVLKKDIN